jgi:hypothetical protein
MNVPFGSVALFPAAQACGATLVSTLGWSTHRLVIDLGNAPLGFPLVLDTCTAVGFTPMSTTLFAGFRCPASWLSYGCSIAVAGTAGYFLLRRR